MAIIRMDQTGYATNTVRNRSTEALQAYGEQAILLNSYTPGIHEGDVNRCENCWDDVYAQSEYTCPICFGVGFNPPFDRISRVWSLFENANKDEKRDKRGEYFPDRRTVYIEGWVTVTPGDFLIRVRKWDAEYRPIELAGRYQIGDLVESNLRTGADYAQEADDRVGQRTNVNFLERSHPLYRFPIKSDTIVQRYDGQSYGAEV